MTDNDGRYIRIRCLPDGPYRDGPYIWELFTREGEVLTSSHKFYTRADAEQDAEQQHVPILASRVKVPS